MKRRFFPANKLLREIIPCYFIAQMDKQPTATSPRNSFARLWPWLVILIVLLFTGFIRFRLLDMPLERDEGEYAYAGQLILQGIPPYDLAYNMKQQGIFFDLFGICFFIGCEIKKRPAPWFDLAKKCFSFGVAMLLPFGLTCLYLFFAGVFPRFWFWTFTYARSYAAEESLQSGIQVLCTYLKDTHILYLEFYILVIAGLLLALRNKTVRKQLIFLTAFSICSGLATATGFYFRRHYFILALPAFAILIGLAITSVQQLLQIKMARNASIIVSLILFAAILGRNIFIQREFFFQASGNQICQTIYRNFPFI